MSRMPTIMIYVLLTSLIIFNSCSESNPYLEKEINVTVSIPPFADVVKNIVGNRAKVHTLIPAGTNVHSYEPNPSTMKMIYESEVYFRVGEIFKLENIIINKIGFNNIKKLVDCSEGIEFINNDPHIWLSPLNVKIISKNILNNLNQLYPQHKNYFTNNKNRFISKLDSVDKIITEKLASKVEKTILVYHPAWNYLADYYGLEEMAVEKDGKSPKAEDLREVIEFAKSKGLKCIFFDPHFDDSSVKAIAESLNLSIDSLDPLPVDYIQNLSDVGSKLDKYLK